MAFNSNTYRANKYLRKAKAEMAEAREIKARVAAGTAYSWEAPRIAFLARMARISMRLSRSYRSMA